MVLLVTGIGLLVVLYSVRYFAVDRGGLHRIAGLLLVFTAAMLGVVTAANLLVLYVAWELTSVMGGAPSSSHAVAYAPADGAQPRDGPSPGYVRAMNGQIPFTWPRGSRT